MQLPFFACSCLVIHCIHLLIAAASFACSWFLCMQFISLHAFDFFACIWFLCMQLLSKSLHLLSAHCSCLFSSCLFWSCLVGYCLGASIWTLQLPIWASLYCLGLVICPTFMLMAKKEDAYIWCRETYATQRYTKQVCTWKRSVDIRHMTQRHAWHKIILP